MPNLWISFYLFTHRAVYVCRIVFLNWIMAATGHILLHFVRWNNNRKLSCFSDWYSFVNRLQGWQTMDKMASLYPHERMSVLAYKQNKSNLLASKEPSSSIRLFHPPCIYSAGLWERRAVWFGSLLCRQSLAEGSEDVCPQRTGRGWMPPL